MYEVQVTLAHDASGGNATITVGTDPRYESFLKRVELQVLGAAADETFQLEQRLAGSGFTSSISGTTFRNAVSSFTPGFAWWDCPILLPIDQVQNVIANTDGDTSVLTMWIFNFDIDATHRVPLSVIANSLGRASQMSND